MLSFEIHVRSTGNRSVSDLFLINEEWGSQEAGGSPHLNAKMKIGMFTMAGRDLIPLPPNKKTPSSSPNLPSDFSLPLLVPENSWYQSLNQLRRYQVRHSFARDPAVHDEDDHNDDDDDVALVSRKRRLLESTERPRKVRSLPFDGNRSQSIAIFFMIYS